MTTLTKAEITTLCALLDMQEISMRYNFPSRGGIRTMQLVHILPFAKSTIYKAMHTLTAYGYIYNLHISTATHKNTAKFCVTEMGRMVIRRYHNEEIDYYVS
jgi:predicted transcriptional regulator